MPWSCRPGKDSTHPCIYGSHVRHRQISTHLPLSRLCTCQSSSPLIVCLGAAPIYVPFGPQCNFMVSIIKSPPALVLPFRGACIRNYTVISVHMCKEHMKAPFTTANHCTWFIVYTVNPLIFVSLYFSDLSILHHKTPLNFSDFEKWALSTI